MDIPTSYIEKFRSSAAQKADAPRSEWEELLDRFLAELNPGRVAAGFQPYTHARLGRILKKQGIDGAPSAYLFFRRCEQGHSFSRLFSYLTKIKHEASA